MIILLQRQFIPSREVANSTEGKNLNTLAYGVEEFVSPSLINFDPNYLRTGKTACLPEQMVKLVYWESLLDWSQIVNTQITTQTCTIRRRVWNLPHEFQLLYTKLYHFFLAFLFINCVKQKKNSDFKSAPSPRLQKV